MSQERIKLSLSGAVCRFLELKQRIAEFKGLLDRMEEEHRQIYQWLCNEVKESGILNTERGQLLLVAHTNRTLSIEEVKTLEDRVLTVEEIPF